MSFFQNPETPILLFRIIAYSLGTAAAFLTLRTYYKKAKKELEEKRSRKEIYYVFSSVFFCLILWFVVVYNYGYLIENELSPKTLVENFDISGSYTGFISDELGHKETTRLVIQKNSNDDVTFNLRTEINREFIAKYYPTKRIIESEEFGSGRIVVTEQLIIIESIENIEKWRFIKIRER